MKRLVHRRRAFMAGPLASIAELAGLALIAGAAALVSTVLALFLTGAIVVYAANWGWPFELPPWGHPGSPDDDDDSFAAALKHADEAQRRHSDFRARNAAQDERNWPW